MWMATEPPPPPSLMGREEERGREGATNWALTWTLAGHLAATRSCTRHVAATSYGPSHLYAPTNADGRKRA